MSERVIAIMAVFEEELMLPGALESMKDVGVDEVHVFDGAWQHFGRGNYASTDRTEDIAREHGAVWHPAERFWESQEEKRTAMFHEAGAVDGDYLLIFDADERFEGWMPEAWRLALPLYCLMNKCVGGNDLPGLRGVWPHGDYSEEYIPALRLFRWHPSLKCLWPGGYMLNGELLHVYEPDEKAYGGYGSQLPILGNCSFTHHGMARDEAKVRQKIAYYQQEHPKRKKRQNEYHND